MLGTVVLNYVNYDETIRCVDSLLSQQDVDYHIIVVENGSNNESEKILKDRYDGNQLITVVATHENLGFARGMNVGIDYLREMGCDFIFLANSDLVFESDTSMSDMVKAYRPGVGAISPIIVNTDGRPAVYITFKKKFMRLRMVKTFLEGIIKKIKKKLSKGKTPAKKKEYGHERAAIKPGVLNDKYEITGSGYMLTPDFFAHYSRLYPETFLGGEEYTTILYLDKSGLKTCWAETVPIIHKHGASTPKDITSDKTIYNGVKKAGFGKIIKLFPMTESEINKRYAK